MIGGLVKSSGRIALVIAACLLFNSVLVKAADLGGDCCADLEERVAELESTTARKGNRKISLTVYGQVNRAIVWHDDENAKGHFQSRDNNGRSGSRFGFKGRANINADLTAGYRMEIGVDNSDKANDGSVEYRHTMVYLQSKALGTIKLGRTSSATDGIAEIALESAISQYSCEELQDVITNCSTSSIDGSRERGVHYVSPTFAGFSVSASWFHDDSPDIKNDDGYSAALRYAGEFGAIRIAAGIGYQNKEDGSNVGDGTDTKTISGSASVMHVPSGIFLNTVYGVIDTAADEQIAYYISGGIKGKWLLAGSTTFEIGYGASESNNYDSEPMNITAGVSQEIDAAAMDVYLIYQYNDADIMPSNTLTNESNAITAGARIKF
ncbi:MAG: porin [Hyphomicrobiaceae bacterium]|nr:porin [Hyphomicrobiaceae bacterium]